MAKSSKKQCRTPKPSRKGGGLVVVSQRNLHSNSTPQQHPQAKKGKKGKKDKKKRGLGLADLSAPGDGDDSDDFDAPPSASAVASTGGVAEYIFSSKHHSREQQLYYLLTTRTSDMCATRGQQQHQPGEGGGIPDAPTAVEGGCHALVFVETTAVAQELVGELKALSLVAFAVHDRTPKAQTQEHVKRFLAATSSERSSVLVLTNLAISRTPPSIGSVKPGHGKLQRVVHFDAPEGKKDAAARARVAGGFFRGRGAGAAEEVYLRGGAEAVGLAPFSFDSGAMGGIRSRLAVAKKLSRAIALSAGEGEERGMQRAAAAAGLEWDEQSSSNERGAEATKREKKRAHAQQAVALRQKVSVLLCQPLLPPLPPPLAALGGSGSAAAFPPAPKNAHQSAKELRKKMVILGMIHGPPQHQAADSGPLAAAAGGRRAGAAEDRAAAQTRWLDGATGKLFGGSWGGIVRTGASCDTASLELRARVEDAKKGETGMRGADGEDVAGRGVATVALARWKPNPDTPDPEKWGGKWGKPCGHNEVVLQHLRPFAPLEVINTRVCSKASPAPGNTGFDGCLELLSLTCRAHGRALTVWDDSSFIHVDKAGACSTLPKQAMLHVPLPTLRFLVKNMRSFTVCGGGQTPPREVARAVLHSAGWGAKQSQFGPLSAELSRRVMSFVLSGDLATWRSISAGFGVGIGLQAGGRGQAAPKDTLAFASKKKRKNFNL
ncbi:conserved unknown protein [Ectocarpus siliculosus]|uniref:Uncharacterized protein n=1 Tax=Ectocarpus siliculosus TaxID=2880 RepID=D7FWM9_ECTSI|nr:conserved unknown protein [Ectocarpus siliculosus]|eukprot:CBJ32117.1 conserved unknown protein [Ectocarpus siliculosus]